MLELPEAIVIAKQLSESVQGKKMIKVIAGYTPHGFAFFNGDPAEYSNILEGKEITQISPLAGFIEISCENIKLLLGDGVNIRYYTKKEELPAKHQLLIELDDHTYLVCTIQMYGGMWAFQEGTYDNPYYLVAKEKPSPLSPAFNESYFYAMLDTLKGNTSIKAALATNQNIPGLGNGVLQDILFRAGIHPKAKLEAMDKMKRNILFNILKETLSEMVSQGGRDTEKDLYGNKGGYPTILSKNTIKYPCPKCGGNIIRQAYLGGNVYYCPTCQVLQ